MTCPIDNGIHKHQRQFMKIFDLARETVPKLNRSLEFSKLKLFVRIERNLTQKTNPFHSFSFSHSPNSRCNIYKHQTNVYIELVNIAEFDAIAKLSIHLQTCFFNRWKHGFFFWTFFFCIIFFSSEISTNKWSVNNKNVRMKIESAVLKMNKKCYQIGVYTKNIAIV